MKVANTFFVTSIETVFVNVIMHLRKRCIFCDRVKVRNTYPYIF